MGYSKSKFYSDPAWQPIPGATAIARRHPWRLVAGKIFCFFAGLAGFFLPAEYAKPFILLGLLIFFWSALFICDFVPRIKCPCCGAKMGKVWECGLSDERSLFLACQQCQKFVDLGVSTCP